jgi:hypothetical protein
VVELLNLTVTTAPLSIKTEACDKRTVASGDHNAALKPLRAQAVRTDRNDCYVF